MKSIPYDGPRRPREEQLQRVQAVIRQELTPAQQEVLRAYYGENRTVAEIAAERGICRSTVYRTLHRAEGRLRKYLKY